MEGTDQRHGVWPIRAHERVKVGDIGNRVWREVWRRLRLFCGALPMNVATGHVGHCACLTRNSLALGRPVNRRRRRPAFPAYAARGDGTSGVFPIFEVGYGSMGHNPAEPVLCRGRPSKKADAGRWQARRQKK
jgi:hypothetical protein